MAEKEFYDGVSLLEEAKRYKTSREFLEVLYQNFNGVKELLVNGLGARLMAICSALPERFHGVDINQGSIDRAREFIANWEMYRNEMPFKTEFHFLEEKGLKLNFRNCYFYLLPDFPNYLIGNFDGELASELFLHLTPEQIKEILSGATRNLKPQGKFIFTIYPVGNENSLDERFFRLGSSIGMRREDFIEDGIINIKKLSEFLQKNTPEVYHRNKREYWLDLTKVRAFPTSDIEKWCSDSGFHIKEREAISCGMFPSAYRHVYTLIKQHI